METYYFMASRTPDYNVKAMNKTTGEKARIGAGWLNEDGTISIVLNPFTILESKPELLITIFPKDKET